MTATPADLNRPLSTVLTCCICAKQMGHSESVVEERPTGESWKLENWYYCVDCWLAMKKLRQRSINPEILLTVLEL